MSDWVTEAVEHSHEWHARKRIEVELQVHRAKLIEMRGRDITTDLRDQVQRDVRKYNTQRHADAPKIDFIEVAFGFLIRTTEYPMVSLEVGQSEPGRMRLKYQYTRKFNEALCWHRYLDVNLDKNSETILECGAQKFGSLSDASRFILAPFLIPFDPPDDALPCT